MRLDIELQYAEFHPDQVEKIGKADLDQALKVIHNFPWTREFEKIDDRASQNLTSTAPSVTIRKGQEMLIVSAKPNDTFVVELLTRTHQGELLIRSGAPGAFTLEKALAMFYEGTIQQVIRLRALKHPATSISSRSEFGALRIFFSYAVVVLMFLILMIDLIGNGFTKDALPAFVFIVLLGFFYGLPASLLIQYFLSDRSKEITADHEGLVIRHGGETVTIARDLISEVTIVSGEGNRLTQEFSYTRIKTLDGKAWIITCFVVAPLQLVNQLRVNHKEVNQFFPWITRDLISKKEQARIVRRKEIKKLEFLETFKDYKDSQLRSIINDPKNFADYAIQAASDILAKRKKQ